LTSKLPSMIYVFWQYTALEIYLKLFEYIWMSLNIVCQEYSSSSSINNKRKTYPAKLFSLGGSNTSDKSLAFLLSVPSILLVGRRQLEH
jgi:hypothetical protein